MANIDPTQFKAKFPVFISVDDAVVQNSIDDALVFLSYKQGSPNYTFYQYYLTAHFLILDQQAAAGDAGSANPINSATVGQLSASYAVAGASTMSDILGMIESTSYGQKFWLVWRQEQLYNRPFATIK